MDYTTVTVTLTISKQITPSTDSNPSHPSARIAAVISAAMAAIDLRHLYGDLGEDTTVTINATEEASS